MSAGRGSRRRAIISNAANAKKKRIDARVEATAVFTGHYHAGQVVLPVFGSLVIPSRYGRRFNHGHFKVDDTDLFVTAGMGASSPPLRIYCQPEIIVVDFVRETESVS